MYVFAIDFTINVYYKYKFNLSLIRKILTQGVRQAATRPRTHARNLLLLPRSPVPQVNLLHLHFFFSAPSDSQDSASFFSQLVCVCVCECEFIFLFQRVRV